MAFSFNTVAEYTLTDGDVVTSITFPDGLRHIGQGAFGFNGLGLNTVEFPNSLVFIGKYAFSNTGISSIALPTPTSPGFVFWINDDNQNTFGAGETVSYSGQSFRAKILYTLKDEDVEMDEEGIITACTYDFENGFKDIIIPDMLEGQSVLGIGDGGWDGIFEDKGLTSVEFPEGLELIGNHAFDSNNLSEVVLPSGLKSIGTYAFSWNELDEISLPNSLVFIGSRAFGSNNIENIVLPTPAAGEFEVWLTAGGEIYTTGSTVSASSYDSFSAKIIYTLTDADVVVEEGVILSCSSDVVLTYFVIPETLDGQTVIGIADGSVPVFYKPEGVFLGREIKEVSLPATLERIGDFAFYDNEIKTIEVPDGIVYFGEDAFTLNSGFSGVVLPNIQAVNFMGWIDNYGKSYEGGETVANFYETSYTADFATSVSLTMDVQESVEVIIDRIEKKVMIEAQHLVSVDLYDLSGRKVYASEGRVNQLSVDMTRFSKGIYIVTCTGDAGTYYSQKLIIE
ncbi:MAG: leucine-rich repeat protein [Bacteroidales bacterium]|nr:leucine-rich repeat protein [Bacteroidales bacterium]